jgi:hypothetical protein
MCNSFVYPEKINVDKFFEDLQREHPAVRQLGGRVGREGGRERERKKKKEKEYEYK